MSLNQPSRFANWPNIAVRIVLILAVFAGLNWWVKKQQKQQAQQTVTSVPAVPTPTEAELRDGIVIVFVWDLASFDDLPAIQQAMITWRNVSAPSLYQQLQRLTLYAGQHSQVPLRVALLTSTQKPDAANPDAMNLPYVILPADAPSANDDIKKQLASIKPGPQLHMEVLRTVVRNQLSRTALRRRHVVLLSPKRQILTGNNFNQHLPTEFHFISVDADRQSMDQQLSDVLDLILSDSAGQKNAPAVQPTLATSDDAPSDILPTN